MASVLYTPRAQHRSRSSFNNLYDLLADLDENQVQLLLEELNHTTTSNMAVSQAVGLFEGFESVSPSPRLPQPPTSIPSSCQLQRNPSAAQRMRLSLKTMFKSSSSNSTNTRRSAHRPTTASASSSTRSSPTSYRRISRPMFNLPLAASVSTNDLHALLFSQFMSASLSEEDEDYHSSTSSPSSSIKVIRRHPSTIDMALEAERSAVGLENIGLLGMLEPRPVTPSMMGAGRKSLTPSSSTATMDSIFEVMESV